jgi:hypothetical protein
MKNKVRLCDVLTQKNFGLFWWNLLFSPIGRVSGFNADAPIY